ncbi:MAG: cation:proton antiporter [Planctomycetota bacterium]
MHGTLVDILVLLAAALALGMLAERLRQSAILGYLVAGTLVGPNVLGWVAPGERIDLLAELGASLLLFTIGTEFSLARLRQMGGRSFAAGVAQIAVTGLVAAAAAGFGGLPISTALALGAVVALSSTAVVARLLVESHALDSAHGRQSMGILLVQDIAVVPIVLALSLGTSGGDTQALLGAAGRAAVYAGLLVASFVVFVRFVVPYGLGARAMARNRDLPIVFAVVCALGSAFGAEMAGLPPALGAFVAGVLLGGSPFAAQIRADVAPLHTLLLTVFFAAIGLMGDPAWAVRNAPLVLGTLAAVVLGKAVLAALSMRALSIAGGTALAAGACIAQVGEFSFVIAETARAGGYFDGDLFRLVVTVTVASLALAPLMDAAAGKIAARAPQRAGEGAHRDAPRGNGVLLVGFGPAGRAAFEALPEGLRADMVVIEASARLRAEAEAAGARAESGDARRRDVLEHAGIGSARVLVVAVSDPAASAQITSIARALAPGLRIVTRARYHAVHDDIARAGASRVVDEEALVGRRLAEEAADGLANAQELRAT